MAAARSRRGGSGRRVRRRRPGGSPWARRCRSGGPRRPGARRPTPGQATNVISVPAVARNAPSGPASHEPPVGVQPSEPVQVPSAANSTYAGWSPTSSTGIQRPVRSPTGVRFGGERSDRAARPQLEVRRRTGGVGAGHRARGRGHAAGPPARPRGRAARGPARSPRSPPPRRATPAAHRRRGRGTGPRCRPPTSPRPSRCRSAPRSATGRSPPSRPSPPPATSRRARAGPRPAGAASPPARWRVWRARRRGRAPAGSAACPLDGTTARNGCIRPCGSWPSWPCPRAPGCGSAARTGPRAR